MDKYTNYLNELQALLNQVIAKNNSTEEEINKNIRSLHMVDLDLELNQQCIGDNKSKLNIVKNYHSIIKKIKKSILKTGLKVFGGFSGICISIIVLMTLITGSVSVGSFLVPSELIILLSTALFSIATYYDQTNELHSIYKNNSAEAIEDALNKELIVQKNLFQERSVLNNERRQLKYIKNELEDIINKLQNYIETVRNARSEALEKLLEDSEVNTIMNNLFNDNINQGIINENISNQALVLVKKEETNK